MTLTRRFPAALMPLIVLAATVIAGAQASRPGQQPARDASAKQGDEAPVPKGRVIGRVTAADTSRPIRRARVLLSGAQVPGGRGALTDDEGRFELPELPEGRYTLTAGKTGFITLSYGQRRPLQAGIPIQLADGQELTGIDFSLPRGSVISGRVYDDIGEPLPGASVRVMRYDYAQGNRQLVPVGGAQTDDLGAYRVWGLNPGEYYVSAVTQNPGLGRGAPSGAPPAAIGRGAAGRGGPAFGRPSPGATITQPDSSQFGYAPTFYPGVPSVNEARAVTLGLSVELPSVDFSVLLVRTAKVSGRVTSPDGTPTTAGNVALVPEGSGVRGRFGGGAFASRIDWDGSFGLVNVPPGRYTLRARSDDTVEPLFAIQSLTVGEGDLADLTVILAPGARITGSVVFQSTQGQRVPDPGNVRVAAPLVDTLDLGPNPTARVDRTGTFELAGVQVGMHVFRTQGSPRGWTLKSVMSDGRDIIDTPVSLRSGEELADVTFVFTDRLTEVNGTITDEHGVPVTDYTLLAFADDDQLWGPQSRHIMTARPDQNGKYQMRGLPPGDYLLVTIDPTEQGQWFDPAYLAAHRSAATRFSLAEGDVKAQDFKISTR